MKYFSYDPEGDGFTLHKTAEEAKNHAEDDLACHRDNASEGWSDSVEHVCWGELKQMAFKVNEMTKEDAEHAGICVSNDFDYICDYQLKDLSHAINHVDALADALQKCLKNAEDSAFECFIDTKPPGDAGSVCDQFKKHPLYLDFCDAYQEQISALAAYRGEA